MSYDPQRNAPRPIRSMPSASSDASPTPVDALLDGPKDAHDAGENQTPPPSVTGSPPFSVVPEPTTPDADTPKLVALTAVLTLIGLVAAFRLRRWVLGRGESQET